MDYEFHLVHHDLSCDDDCTENKVLSPCLLSALHPPPPLQSIIKLKFNRVGIIIVAILILSINLLAFYQNI